MWNIYWRFLPRHNRSAAQKNPVNKVCLLFAFSVPTECAAIATGNDFRVLGICHQQAFSRNSGNGISAKYAILRKIALLAGRYNVIDETKIVSSQTVIWLCRFPKHSNIEILTGAESGKTACLVSIQELLTA